MRSLSVSKIKRFYLIKQMDRSDFGDTEKLQLIISVALLVKHFQLVMILLFEIL